MNQQHYPFTLEPLPYPYSALEPYIDEETMHFHHDMHYKTYVDNLNKALTPYPQYQNWTLVQLIAYLEILPKELQTSIRNNAGGVFNHQLYFNTMINRPTNPRSKTANAIINSFGSFDTMKKTLKDTALSVFGSGYAWLVAFGDSHLAILPTSNQDSPLSNNLYPLLLVDVWEHAYYLKNQNRRNEYIDAWFQVINWDVVEKLYMDFHS